MRVRDWSVEGMVEGVGLWVEGCVLRVAGGGWRGEGLKTPHVKVLGLGFRGTTTERKRA